MCFVCKNILQLFLKHKNNNNKLDQQTQQKTSIINKSNTAMQTAASNMHSIQLRTY